MSGNVTQELAREYRLFGAAMRWRMLAALREGPQTATQLEDRLGITQSMTSRHLGVLRAMGVVDSPEKPGEPYRLNAARLRAIFEHGLTFIGEEGGWQSEDGANALP